MKNVLNKYRTSNCLSANLAITSGVNTSKGTIIMQDNCFKLQTLELRCWYDGKSMWTYSKDVGEVNLTSPTNEELQSMNPYIALNNYKSDNRVTLLKSYDSDSYVLKLSPISPNKSTYREIVISVSKTSYYITKAVIVMTNGQQSTIHITGYRALNKYKTQFFQFTSSEVPKSTPVIDLR
ncbi:MAG: LolA-like putative outer membrane lipoprotein chaperone [Muribaculaceae bacterium]